MASLPKRMRRIHGLTKPLGAVRYTHPISSGSSGLRCRRPRGRRLRARIRKRGAKMVPGLDATANGSALRSAFAAAVIALSAGLGLADTIVKKDGKVLEGRVISQSDKEVVFEWTKFGRTQISIPMEEVASVKIGESQAEKKQGPGYVVLPLHGIVGKEITAHALSEGFTAARIDKPSIVILAIDSPGGSVPETEKILDVMERNGDLFVVAHVADGYSAAAIIAMCCPRIYIAPEGGIGAAVPYREGAKGVPQVIEEKYQSVIRAMFRRAPEMGEHSVLLARGMMEAELELSVVKTDGKPVIVEGLKGTPLKRKGRILTLNATEAVACGLAAGKADRPETVNVAMGVPVWHLAGKHGWDCMERIRQDREAQERQAALVAEEMSYAKAAGPTLAKIDEMLKVTELRLKSERGALRSLEGQYDAEVLTINAQYEQACQEAARFSKAVAAELRLRAREIRDARVAVMQARYQPQAAVIKARIKELVTLQDELNRQRRAIFANRPK